MVLRNIFSFASCIIIIWSWSLKCLTSFVANNAGWFELSTLWSVNFDIVTAIKSIIYSSRSTREMVYTVLFTIRKSMLR